MNAAVHFPFDPVFEGSDYIEEQRERYWAMREILYKPKDIEEIAGVWRPG